jgi:hypothetical protein
MTNLGHQTGLLQVALAAAAAVAALTIITAPFATDDTNFVNDNGQTSGDIFTQNAQAQN